MSPLDLIPGAPIAFVELGDGGAHDPQLKIEAPDSSCIWNDYPVELRACYFHSGKSKDPFPTSQLTGYVAGPGVGPFTPPSTTWPLMQVYNVLHYVLSGLRFEVKITGRITFGTMQVGVANPSTGNANDPSGTYYSGSFDTGWFDAGGPDCAQSATTPGPEGTLTYGVVLRPFSPIVGAGIVEGQLFGRWVVDTPSGAIYEPFQTFAVIVGPPQPGYLQSTLYDQSSQLVGLAGSHGTSPPSGMANSIVPADSGMTDDGASSGSHGSAWYPSQAFASTCKVSFWPRVMPANGDGMWLYARLADPGTSSVTGYAMRAVMPNTYELYRIDAGVLTLLDTTSVLQDFKEGDGFQLECEGDQIRARFHDGDVMVVCYADIFADVLTTTDGTYRSEEAAANVAYTGMGLDGTTARVYDWNAGSFADPMPGLYVYLETDACGNATKTYTQVADAIVLDPNGFNATTLGGHGSDTAAVDKDVMTGADCSGGVNDKGAVPL